MTCKLKYYLNKRKLNGAIRKHTTAHNKTIYITKTWKNISHLDTFSTPRSVITDAICSSVFTRDSPARRYRSFSEKRIHGKIIYLESTVTIRINIIKPITLEMKVWYYNNAKTTLFLCNNIPFVTRESTVSICRVSVYSIDKQ